MISRKFYSCFICAVLILCACTDMDKQDFNKATEANSIVEYERYLANHPEGKFIDSTKAILKELYFTKAKKEPNKELLQQYLDKFPRSKYREEAIQILKDIEEREQFKAIVKTNNLDSLKTYRIKYPESKYSKDAYHFIDSLTYVLAKLEQNVPALNNYLDSFPDGKYSSQAQKQLDGILNSYIPLTNKKLNYDKMGNVTLVEITSTLNDPVKKIRFVKNMSWKGWSAPLYSVILYLQPFYYKGKTPLQYKSLAEKIRPQKQTLPLYHEYEGWKNQFFYDKTGVLVGIAATDSNNTILAELELKTKTGSNFIYTERHRREGKKGEYSFIAESQFALKSGFKFKEKAFKGQKQKEYFFLLPGLSL